MSQIYLLELMFTIKKKNDMDIIIKRSSQLPAFGTKNYKTHEDYQTFIINDIYEGENKELS